MKNNLFFLILILCSKLSFGQTVNTIVFNLYTDSLKKGFYNYINVDGQYADGHWLPLDSTQILFSANSGYFRGNDLFIDSSYKEEKVTVKAVLKENPAIWKETTIYIRKRPFTEPLPSAENILGTPSKSRRRK